MVKKGRILEQTRYWSTSENFYQEGFVQKRWRWIRTL